MRLRVERDTFTEQSTTGKLFVNDVFECYVLEDKARPQGVKIPGETCIPEGDYKVILVQSPKRGYIVPLLVDVKGWTGIELHIGNSNADTLGCLLVGKERTADYIMHSTDAFNALMVKLNAAAYREEEIRIAIHRAVPEMEPAKTKELEGVPSPNLGLERPIVPRKRKRAGA